VHLDRARHVAALVRLRHILIVDPPPAVRRDFVPGLEKGVHHRRIALHRKRDSEDGQWNVVALEQPQQPPHAGARSIFVDLLHAHVPRARHRRRIGNVGEEDLGASIAVEDIGFGALLIIQHALHGDPRAARPRGMRRRAAVAGQIARVAILSHMHRLSNMRG
jgi:hypothetical protein